MRKTLKFQTRKRVRQLLDKKNGKANLRRLKKSRYMREAYQKEKKRLMITLELADFEKIRQHATLSGIPPTTLLRACALAYLDDERVLSKNTENTLSELVFLLRNIGNNINQIAKQSNTVQKLAFGDFMHTKSLVKTLEDTAIQAIKRLS